MVNALSAPPNPFPNQKRWTCDDCRKLEAMEILSPGTYELVDGEIIQKRGQNEPHVRANMKTLFALTLIFGPDYVRHASPVNLGINDNPEPDVAVTVLPGNDYLVRGTPNAADIRLVVEVSDSTLWFDRNTKASEYAAAGIVDYWIVDLNARRLIVHRQPTVVGYAQTQEFGETDSISPLAAPAAAIMVADLLP